jgi:hypothetical protein
MKQDELMRAGLLLLILSAVMLMSSCSVQRETGRSIYDVQFQSPIKYNKVDKCN